MNHRVCSIVAAFCMTVITCYADEAVPPSIPDTVVVPPQQAGRYAPRVADWIWTAPEFAYLIDENFRAELERDIRYYEWLRGQSGLSSYTFDKLEIDIARRLSEKFSIRDLTRGLDVLRAREGKAGLCVRFDPQFSANERETLLRAVQLFLEVATATDVIDAAFAESIEDPAPIPDQYEMQNGTAVKDRYGNPSLTDGYSLKLLARTRPPNAEFFRNQLEELLSLINRDPGLLVIASYAGDQWKDEWWGGGYYGFYYSPHFRLQREVPARGYLYIRINTDRMKAGKEQFDNPAFWAGKIAHECLHNLWYRHPSYKNAADRDANNPDGKKAFIFAYEQRVISAAQKLLSSKR